MRGLLMDPSPQDMEERRRLGLDKRDEMWDGEIHMVPPPSGQHMRFELRLGAALLPLVDARGLDAGTEGGLFRTDEDYRVPDLMVFRPGQLSRRGVEMPAELVVEIVSPGDESRKKLPWYIAHGVSEVLLIRRDTLAVELYVADREGRPKRVEPPQSTVLGCAFERVGDNHLRLVTDAGTHDIVL